MIMSEKGIWHSMWFASIWLAQLSLVLLHTNNGQNKIVVCTIPFDFFHLSTILTFIGKEKENLFSVPLWNSLVKARWRNLVLLKSNFSVALFLTYISSFSLCFSKTIYFLCLLLIYGTLIMCSVLRIMNKFAMFSFHIAFIIINFGSFVVKLRKAEIRYSQTRCVFLTMCPLGSTSHSSVLFKIM